MLRTLLLFGLTCVFSVLAYGQQRIPANQNIYGVGNRGIIYDNELNFSLALATPRDIFLGVRAGKLVSYDKMKYWSASIGSIRHSRERRENPERINFLTNRVSRSYTFGKENQLYALRVGFGTRKYLSEKARVKGVAVGYSYEIGPSLGILKPYYLEVYADEPGNQGIIVDVRHDGTNTAEFLNQDRIFGASAWTVGLGEVSLRPGIHGKFATHFGFGAYDEVAKSLEAGILADFFLGETDLMIESELTPGVTNTPFYLSLYLKVQLGKRW
ncbi:hypothetical protein QWY85_00820 [Neolewinella lacunae]|uniref:Uncharacterized protein n=1 Tax=Neolewinella lacunae TaxID=1517758 RepID=A0A923PKZ5_9BACT|nr:hypothetical protein [Neolewinella lacunae]MBC6996002.1 hypothetical protein [Neolewinella lacunae]MDN3633176.1 hypothetical protein [Neolewinella lacunae]